MITLDNEMEIDLLDLRACSTHHRAATLRPSVFPMVDTHEGVVSDPMSLHKYLYANADPVNHIDPTGKFSTTEIMVTAGIIGAIGGASIGTYIGYRKTGTLFSKETLGYALIGAGAGFAIGLMIGGAIGPLVGGGMPTGALGSVAKISSKLVQTVARGKFMKVSPLTFTAGVIAGVATEVTTPDAYDTWITPISLLVLPANSLGLIMYRTFVTRRVPGPVQETIAFVAGFNVGYFGAKNLPDLPNTLRHIPELAGDVFDAVTGD
jgi:hypothetical protein